MSNNSITIETQGEMSALGGEYIKSRDLDVIMPITLWGRKTKQRRKNKIKLRR